MKFGARWIAAALLTPSLALAETDLSKLSLQQLTDTEISVTSVAKRPEKLSDSAAAITVITGDEIRRSGVTTLPDAIRMAPGVEVAQIDSSRWAISIRGFNSATSNKLLILVDGRIVYNPLFAQTYWNGQDVLLEDVDRIEVIRGPGATLWGSNAVNGVINIITLAANETQGNLLTGLAGKRENNTFSFRTGGKEGDLFYRVYGKTFHRDPFTNKNGVESVDDWAMGQAGFRIDQKSGKDTLTIQGDHYKGDDHQLTDSGTSTGEEYSGSNILGRWVRTFSPTQSLSMQAYYDRTDRDSGYFGETRENYDFEIQYNSSPAKGHSLVIGATARRSVDEIRQKNPLITLDPTNSSKDLYSFFIQDEIDLSKKFRLILGDKFEHNDFSGWETQPTIRALYKVEPHKTLWVAYSRAVRIPTRVDEDFRVSNTVRLGPILATANFDGSKNFNSEIEKSYEFGYRVEPARNLSIDLTAFYVDYTNLETVELLPLRFTFPPPHLFLDLVFGNKAAANGRGVELAGTWTVNNRWKLSGSYSRLTLNAHNLNDSTAPTKISIGESPANQFQIRSSLNLRNNLEFDTMLYFVNALTVPDYARLDLRLGWHLTPNLEISGVAQNLFSGRHREISDATATFIVPATFAKISIKF